MIFEGYLEYEEIRFLRNVGKFLPNSVLLAFRTGFMSTVIKSKAYAMSKTLNKLFGHLH
jgi:hypothetical protein